MDVPVCRSKCCYCGHIDVNGANMPDACPQCSHTLLVPEGGDGLILLQVEME